jgi:cell division protein FtsQ
MVALALFLALLGGVWVWLRDSSLVAVRSVQVAGASGPDGAGIREALVTAARNMTTLDVKMSELRTAVEPYPVVKSLIVNTQFPHGMRIRVVEQVPVAVIDAGGRRTAVSGDGTLLHDVAPVSSLPTISLTIAPGGTRLNGYALTEARLLAAAPWQLLGKVGSVSDGAAHGLVAQLRQGPSIYFGDATQLGAKWTAAAEVLAASGSAGAEYVDVTVPDRPAAGAEPGSSGTGAAGTGASTATTPTGAPAPGSGAASTTTAPTGSTVPGG